MVRAISRQAKPESDLHRLRSRLARAKVSVLTLIAEGRSNKEIARILSIAPETVKTHVKHIFIKLDVERRAQAVSRAQSLGLVGTSIVWAAALFAARQQPDLRPLPAHDRYGISSSRHASLKGRSGSRKPWAIDCLSPENVAFSLA